MLLWLVPALVGCSVTAPGSSASAPASSDGAAVTPGAPVESPPRASTPDTTSPQPTVVAPTPTRAGSSVLLNCGDRGRDFPADALSGPGTAEVGTDLAAAILRSTIATAPEETPFPPQGWHRVLDDERGAWFVAAGDDRTPWWQISVGEINGVLQATDYGACHLSKTAPTDDVSLGRWWLDPAGEAPSADTTELSILVRETDCASGRSPEGRILPPTFVVNDDAIEVTIAIRRRPGDQDCPANPAYSMRLELPEVLGPRSLFDASWYPPRLATTQDPG